MTAAAAPPPMPAVALSVVWPVVVRLSAVAPMALVIAPNWAATTRLPEVAAIVPRAAAVAAVQVIVPAAPVVTAPAAITREPVVAVTVMVPAPPVVRLAFCATLSALTTRAPVVEATLAPRMAAPVSAARVTGPEPLAVTTALTVSAPVATSTLMGPLPARVRRPVPVTRRAAVSLSQRPPVTALVACTEPRVVNRAALPAAPRPVLAVRVSRPVVTTLGGVPAAAPELVIAPSAWSVTALEIVLT